MTPDPFDSQPRRRGWTTTATIVAVVAALVVVVVAFMSPALSGGGPGTSEQSDETASPSEFVDGYLHALADGDADAALEYVALGLAEGETLNDEMLAASLERGPITDIDVGEAEEIADDEVAVPVSFRIGDTAVSQDIAVSIGLSGDLAILSGTQTIPTDEFAGMGLTVNGIPVEGELTLFPGTYEFAVANTNFTIERGEPVVVASGHESDRYEGLRPVLTDAATATYRSLVAASLQECAAMKTLTTPCGDDVIDSGENGPTPVDGTVTRELPLESESKLAAVTVVTDGTVARWESSVGMSTTFESPSGSRYLATGAALKTPKVDFAAETPQVVWE
ncbi:hypothetical protein ACTJKK_08825 [Microbacterium sp. 22179]|uniref:hypothetical protein n=1 Tax=Microbacterium sp. 22179 TaxID=3453886 RepID=UPI003F874D69